MAPWSYIYDIPLETGVKPALCPMVAQWDGKKPLFAGAPRQCPHGPHRANVLCPFGFWGYRYTVEQPPSSDQPVLNIRAAPDCNVVVGEAQYGFKLKMLSDHVARLPAILGKMPFKTTLKEGKTKKSIAEMLGTDLQFVYFYCHGERSQEDEADTVLGVGDRELVAPDDFIDWTRAWYDSQRRDIWGAVRPLIFINACHSVAIEPETLVNFLEAFVRVGHAAGVIGTEIKVGQDIAMQVAESFFTSWMSGEKTVEEALRAIRLDYLSAGNMVGLIYTPYCWSELKIVRQ